MKNLLLIITLFICFNSYSQTDTTVFLLRETITKYVPTVAYESEFITYDTIDFDINQDTVFNSYSIWMRADSIYVNEDVYRIRQIQIRANDQGIKQKKRRRIRYVKKTFVKRIIR